MKKIILSLILLTVATSLSAQRRKKTQVEEPALPQISLEEALANYDFDAAELLLNHEIEKGTHTKQLEKQLQGVKKAQQLMNAVEKVTFIDSIVVPRSEMLSHIPLSQECGKLFTFSDFFKEKDTKGCTVFKSQMGDKIIYAEANEKGKVKLYARDIFNDGSLSEATLLDGISEGNVSDENYPYMMPDGTTIYFAAKNDEGLGGYDIYMSRYDAVDRKFLIPENIGMPFNSPANDYLFIIDEVKNRGWFVTDRNTRGNKVCIYTFIPSDTRRTYVPEEVGQDKLRRLARIASIKESQNGMMGGLALPETNNRAIQTADNWEVCFYVTDNIIYRKRSDFKTEMGLKTYDEWTENQKNLNQTRAELGELRRAYHKGNNNERESMKPRILELEEYEEVLVSLLKDEEYSIRNAEIGNKN